MDISLINSKAYSPLLDMKPADHEILMNAMYEAKRLTQSFRQALTIFTADLELFCFSVELLWVRPERFRSFLLGLGGMQTLMSFVGCVGIFMSCSDLEDVMKVVFAGVRAMLGGKTFPNSIRAFCIRVERFS